jgi:hypothetical protein
VLGSRYHVLAPEKLDGKRDQNSMILVAKARFEPSGASEGATAVAGEKRGECVGAWTGEMTADVTKKVGMWMETPVAVAAGDLFVVGPPIYCRVIDTHFQPSCHELDGFL